MGNNALLARGVAAALLAALACAASAQSPPPGQCPQPRFTGKAPDDYYNRRNPLEATAENLAAGEAVYNGQPRRVSCRTCHGESGDGEGRLAGQFDPRPRNFRCPETINGIPDGHLFWIVRYGSPGTSMPPHPRLTDEQVWQVVLYIRKLAAI